MLRGRNSKLLVPQTHHLMRSVVLLSQIYEADVFCSQAVNSHWLTILDKPAEESSKVHGVHANPA